MNNIEVKIIKEITPDFIHQWQKLWEDSSYGHFFNSVYCILACLKAFKIKEYWIFTVFKDGKLVVILPLIKTRKFGVKVFSSPGKKYIEKSTLLLTDKDKNLLDHLMTEIAKIGNIYLTEVPEEIADRLSADKQHSLISLSSINPFITLDENPYRYLTKKQKSKIVNKIKKNIGSLSYGHYRDNLDKHLETVFQIENKSSKKLKRKDSFSNTEIKDLFKALVNIARQYVVIDILYFNGLPIVSGLGLMFKNKYLAYHTAYVNDFRELIPGKMLTFCMLSRLRNEGVSLFDFSRGHNVFKGEFTNKHLLQYDYYYSINPLVRILWNAINSLRRLKQVVIRNRYSLDGYYLFRKYEDIRDEKVIKRIHPNYI